MEVYQKYKLCMSSEQLKVLVDILETFLRGKALDSAENMALSYLVIRIFKRLITRSVTIGNTGRRECKVTFNAFEAAALLCVVRQIDCDQLGALERTVVYMINDVVR